MGTGQQGSRSSHERSGVSGVSLLRSFYDAEGYTHLIEGDIWVFCKGLDTVFHQLHNGEVPFEWAYKDMEMATVTDTDLADRFLRFVSSDEAQYADLKEALRQLTAS